jgi:hypothetical protein
MGKGQGAGVEPYAAALFAAAASVFKVSLYMKIKGGKLGAYLVMPATNKFNLQKEIPFSPAKVFVPEPGLFAARAGTVKGPAFVDAGIGFYPVKKLPLALHDHGGVLDYGPVLFHRLSPGEYPVERRQGAAGFGEKRASRYRHIKTVYRPGMGKAAGAEQGLKINHALARPFHGFSGFFIDYDAPGVIVKYSF